MPISYPAIKSLTAQSRITWTARQTILYALAVGMGDAGADGPALPFLYEKDLLPIPAIVTVMAQSAQISCDRLGVQAPFVMHGEQAIRVHRAIPTMGELIALSQIGPVYDRGASKGAVIVTETTLLDAASDYVIATLRSSAVARADGGFGGPSLGKFAVHLMPQSPPHRTIEIATREDQALLYRLLGDLNPLHADPEQARVAGFDRPILHGLCTYGLCCRAILQAYCDLDPQRLVSQAVRFSGPMFPGETLRVRLWRDKTVISFEADALPRGVTVVKNGKAELAG